MGTQALLNAPANDATDSDPCRPRRLDFDTVYSDHFDFVWRSARGLGLAESSADDVTQDVFMIVHRKLPDFEATGSLKSWLFGITRRVCKDHRRSVKRRGPQLELDAEREVEKADSPHDQAASRQALKAVDQFSAALDSDARELFFLALVEGLPVAEVSKMLEINANTTYSRVRVLRTALAAHLGMTDGGACDE